MKKKIYVPICILITLLIGAGLDFAYFPAYNIHSEGFWWFCLVLGIILFVLLQLCRLFDKSEGSFFQRLRNRSLLKQDTTSVVAGMIIICSVFLLFFGSIISAKIFHAKRYSRLLTVKEGSREDIPTVEGTDAIALMDTRSARKLAEREMGSLTELVSQFEVSNSVSTVNIASKPVKLATLSYASFFKWLQNRKDGIPGYITISPTKMDADYVKLEQGMRYTPSAWLADNLYRRIRWKYRTALLYDVHFELDEEGHPFYVATTYKRTIGLFGGTVPSGCIVADPCTGEMKRYAKKDIPAWVDMVYSGEDITSMFNDSAQLMNGFFNSIIGQKGCRKITENEKGADYGYITKDSDIYYYTGVTSINSDASNLGFLFVNERTGEARFIKCPGADEFSAMKAAEGEVQEKNYTASFPSLININNALTYICVLKDKSDLVKMYACIDASQYNNVAVATTQKECIRKYEALQKGEISAEEAADGSSGQETVPQATEEPLDTTDFQEKTIQVKKLETIVISGDSYLYVVDRDNAIYRAKYKDVVPMLLVEPGDEVKILTDGDRFVLPEGQE